MLCSELLNIVVCSVPAAWTVVDYEEAYGMLPMFLLKVQCWSSITAAYMSGVPYLVAGAKNSQGSLGNNLANALAMGKIIVPWCVRLRYHDPAFTLGMFVSQSTSTNPGQELRVH